MKFTETKIKGLILITPEVYKDTRGFFLESYSAKTFKKVGIDTQFVQDNHAFSLEKNVIRGLHFQYPPYSQAKLVRVTRGAVFDVVVDLRKKSETFGNWSGFELSDKNFLMLYIPKEFAHGYCTLERNTEFLYKTDNFYMKNSEGALQWNDPDLHITWPTDCPILSHKDLNALLLKDFTSPF